MGTSPSQHKNVGCTSEGGGAWTWWFLLFGVRLGDSFDSDATNTPTTLLDILRVLDLLLMLDASLSFSSDASLLLLVGRGGYAVGRLSMVMIFFGKGTMGGLYSLLDNKSDRVEGGVMVTLVLVIIFF